MRARGSSSPTNPPRAAREVAGRRPRRRQEEDLAQAGEEGRQAGVVVPVGDLAVEARRRRVGDGLAEALQLEMQPGGDARGLGRATRDRVLDQLEDGLAAALADAPLPLAAHRDEGDRRDRRDQQHGEVEQPGAAPALRGGRTREPVRSSHGAS
jgi:hypothetical protein